MSHQVLLTAREEEELYILLKPQESGLPAPVEALLRRIEKALFDRLTIEEIEKLAVRFPRGR